MYGNSTVAESSRSNVLVYGWCSEAFSLEAFALRSPHPPTALRKPLNFLFSLSHCCLNLLFSVDRVCAHPTPTPTTSSKDGDRVVELKPGYALPHDENVGGNEKSKRVVQFLYLGRVASISAP